MFRSLQMEEGQVESTPASTSRSANIEETEFVRNAYETFRTVGGEYETIAGFHLVTKLPHQSSLSVKKYDRLRKSLQKHAEIRFFQMLATQLEHAQNLRLEFLTALAGQRDIVAMYASHPSAEFEPKHTYLTQFAILAQSLLCQVNEWLRIYQDGLTNKWLSPKLNSVILKAAHCIGEFVLSCFTLTQMLHDLFDQGVRAVPLLGIKEPSIWTNTVDGLDAYNRVCDLLPLLATIYKNASDTVTPSPKIDVTDILHRLAQACSSNFARDVLLTSMKSPFNGPSLRPQIPLTWSCVATNSFGTLAGKNKDKTRENANKRRATARQKSATSTSTSDYHTMTTSSSASTHETSVSLKDEQSIADSCENSTENMYFQFSAVVEACSKHRSLLPCKTGKSSQAFLEGNSKKQVVWLDDTMREMKSDLWRNFIHEFTISFEKTLWTLFHTQTVTNYGGQAARVGLASAEVLRHRIVRITDLLKIVPQPRGAHKFVNGQVACEHFNAMLWDNAMRQTMHQIVIDKCQPVPLEAENFATQSAVYLASALQNCSNSLSGQVSCNKLLSRLWLQNRMLLSLAGSNFQQALLLRFADNSIIWTAVGQPEPDEYFLRGTVDLIDQWLEAKLVSNVQKDLDDCAPEPSTWRQKGHVHSQEYVRYLYSSQLEPLLSAMLIHPSQQQQLALGKLMNPFFAGWMCHLVAKHCTFSEDGIKNLSADLQLAESLAMETLQSPLADLVSRLPIIHYKNAAIKVLETDSTKSNYTVKFFRKRNQIEPDKMSLNHDATSESSGVSTDFGVNEARKQMHDLPTLQTWKTMRSKTLSMPCCAAKQS